MGILLSVLVIIQTHLVENLSVMPHAKYLSCQIEVLFKSISSTLHFHFFFLSIQFYRRVLQLKDLTRAPHAEANEKLIRPRAGLLLDPRDHNLNKLCKASLGDGRYQILKVLALRFQ